MTGQQGSKLLGFRMSGTPKNGDGNPLLGPGFPTGNPGIVRLTDNFKIGFLTGNPEIAEEIQILRQVFRTETQILIVISSPGSASISLKTPSIWPTTIHWKMPAIIIQLTP